MLNELTLLVVDDEQVVCQACDRVLSRQGFKVETVNDPQEGLLRAAEKPYAALLLDIKMPTMDGISFLQALRKDQPDLPVVVMTGYPTIQNAAAAVRLGAKDYVVKPFTPEEITRAVREALHSAQGTPAPLAALRERGAEDGREGTDDLLFYDEAWLQRGSDGAVVCGASRPAGEASVPSQVRLPRLGEVVYQGLPLAEVRYRTAATQIVPAPVSGVVIAVNDALERDAAPIDTDRFGRGWLAAVSPTRLDEELPRCIRRRVVVLSPAAAGSAVQRSVLEACGCSVRVAENWDALTRAAAQDAPGLVVLHVTALGEQGPGRVGQLRSIAPAAKVMVVAPSPSTLEPAYRAQKIFYYAVEPVAEAEWVTVIDSAFRLPRPAAPATASNSSLEMSSPAIQQMTITNRQGKRVCLVAVAPILHRNIGLGKVLRERLLERLFPLETQLGDRELSQADIADLATRFDRVLVLVTQDCGRIPGSLVRDTKETYVALSGKDANNVLSLVVQPNPQPGAPLAFDARITETLADFFVAEMASV